MSEYTKFTDEQVDTIILDLSAKIRKLEKELQDLKNHGNKS